jgi:hypothetical protein
MVAKAELIAAPVAQLKPQRIRLQKILPRSRMDYFLHLWLEARPQDPPFHFQGFRSSPPGLQTAFLSPPFANHREPRCSPSHLSPGWVAGGVKLPAVISAVAHSFTIIAEFTDRCSLRSAFTMGVRARGLSDAVLIVGWCEIKGRVHG